jgi:hypothetical protein
MFAAVDLKGGVIGGKLPRTKTKLRLRAGEWKLGKSEDLEFIITAQGYTPLYFH